MRKWIFLATVFVAAAVLGIALFAPRPPRQAAPGTAYPERVTTAEAPPFEPLPPPAWNPPSTEACTDVPAFASAAARNAADIDALVWTPFGRPETGWRLYAPHIAVEIGSTCGYDSPGFANALAGWQKAHGKPATGVMDPDTFDAMKVRWHLKRPFVILSRAGGCPPAPPPGALSAARPDEVYGAKPIELRADALAAYRRMVSDARAQDPAIARDRQSLLIFSGFRSPLENELRCFVQGGCDNVSRAPCSAHRTGLAFDIVVGSAPGGRVDSTENLNRLAQTQTPAYRWLVRNAHRYGFVNYVFEPWHWEWSPPEQRGATRA